MLASAFSTLSPTLSTPTPQQTQPCPQGDAAMLHDLSWGSGSGGNKAPCPSSMLEGLPLSSSLNVLHQIQDESEGP